MFRKLSSAEIMQLRKYAGLSDYTRYAGKGTAVGGATGGVLGGIAGLAATTDEKDSLRRFAKVLAYALMGGTLGAAGGYGYDAAKAGNKLRGKYNAAADKYNKLIGVEGMGIKPAYDAVIEAGMNPETSVYLTGGKMTNLGNPEYMPIER